MKTAKRDPLVVILLSFVLAYFLFFIVQSELPRILSDFNGHVYVCLPLFTSESFFEGWKTVPYFIWHLLVLILHHVLHIPLEVSAAYASIFFKLLTFNIVYWMIIKYTDYKKISVSTVKAAFIAFGFSIIQPLYFSWLDAGERFLGSFSMNALFNPTQLTVAPFSLLCFCLVYDIWNRQEDASYEGTFFCMSHGLKKPYIYLSIMLLLSTLAKPVFAEMFIPAVAFIMLFKWISLLLKKDTSAGMYFKNCLHMLLCAVPAILYILLQIFAFLILGGSHASDDGFLITKWLEVWSMFTENVALSVLLGMAFPLLILLLDARFFFKNNLGKLALVGYLVGFLEAAFLGEGGPKLSHGNFLWPMMSGMLLMYAASTLRLLELESAQPETKTKRYLTTFAWVMFFAHAFCGFLYIKSFLVP